LVLVTGTPRSGTTAVGDVLAYAPGARYLYEPFNRHVGMREIDVDFPVPGTESFPVAVLHDIVDRIRRVDLDLRSGVFPHDTGAKRVWKRVTGSRTTMSYRLSRFDPTRRTIVWKDPFALYSVGEVATSLGVPVVVTVRNPWAVAASFKRLHWGFDVVDLARRLDEAVGAPRASRVIAEVDPRSYEDPVVNAALHWRLAHEMLLATLGERQASGVTAVDLDQIVAAPEAAYASLYERTGLRWTPTVARRIRRRYRPREAPAQPHLGRSHDRDRDVRAVNRYWTSVLSEPEVDTIERIAGSVWTAVQGAFTPLL
jgi:hypothetical protein